MDELRQEVCALHAELARNRLVAWTSGNLSGRSGDAMVIKPSGVGYDDLTPQSMVVCDLYGDAVGGSLAPSSDAATHGYIYRHMPDVGGIVHTHSPYATAWAVRGEAIPCVMTAIADEFGGEIPVGPFALVGDEEIGRGVVDTLAGQRSRAVLMRNHGVFALGETPREAVKCAVMCEDAARTVHLARMLGPIEPLDAGAVDALYDRYQNVYGQH
jgi:L-ribulose-5-phosphate 4-epimerase